jgi:hypothetical protein
MLAWFAENSWAYEVGWQVVWLSACGWVVRGIFRNDPSAAATSDWKWSFVVVLVLLAGRWPTFFVTREYNPDESQMLAGALTLRHDPVFWRAVDGDTVGPLGHFALLPFGSLLGEDSYFSARLTGLCLIALSLMWVHGVIARSYGRQLARVVTLPAVGFEALTLEPNLIHYSSELVPCALLSGALFCAVRWIQVGYQGRWRIFLAGFLLGAAPLGKPQATPIALLLGLSLALLAAGRIRRRQPEAVRDFAGLISGAVLPALFCSVILLATHQVENAVIPYYRNNVDYVQLAGTNETHLVREWLAAMSNPGTLIFPWLAGVAVTVASVGLAFRSFRPLTSRWPWCALVLVLTAVACIATPRRPYLHYLQLGVGPTVLFVACLLGAGWRLRGKQAQWARGCLAGAFCLSVVLLAGARSRVRHPAISLLETYQRFPTSPVADGVLRFAQRGDALGLWGWHNRYYVETGLRQATRNANSRLEILEGPYNAYFRQRYLSDLQASRPAVFLDSSDDPAFGFPAQEVKHEQSFPELGRFIRENYTYFATVNRVRIFVRSDRYVAWRSEKKSGL